jgi:hypothetical protein
LSIAESKHFDFFLSMLPQIVSVLSKLQAEMLLLNQRAFLRFDVAQGA